MLFFFANLEILIQLLKNVLLKNLTINCEVDNFAEPCSDAINSLAQIKALVIFLNSGKHQRSIGVNFGLMTMLVTTNVFVVTGSIAASFSPGDTRWWKTIGVAMQNEARHTFRGMHVLGFH